METEDKEIYLIPTSQLLLTSNVVKGTVTTENFQISLGDGIPKASLNLPKVTNELARVNLDAMECKTIGEDRVYKLKIKMPDLCARKIKEIGLYYRERPRDAQNKGILIAYSYQDQACHEDKGEELALQLVLPYNEESKTENTNNLQHSMSTEGTAGLERTVQAAETTPTQCIVRDKNDVCLLVLPNQLGAHNNYWGIYNIKVVDTNDERTIVSVTSESYPTWGPEKFTIPMGYNLVPNELWWNYWRVEKDVNSEGRVELNKVSKELENKKDQIIKELQDQLDEQKNQIIKELKDKIKKIENDPESDKQERKKDISSKADKEIAELRERLKKLEGDGTNENEKKKKELNDAIEAINKKIRDKIDTINNEKSEDRLKELIKKALEDFGDKNNKDKKINQPDKKLEELEKKLEELEKKQAGQFNTLNINSCCCC